MDRLRPAGDDRAGRTLAAASPKDLGATIASLRATASRPPWPNRALPTTSPTTTSTAGTEVSAGTAPLADTGTQSSDLLGYAAALLAAGGALAIGRQRRRGRHATVLTRGASTLSTARDWPRLRGDGQRTVLGEQLRNGSV